MDVLKQQPSAEIQRIVLMVWNDIAPDAEGFCRNNLEAIESCIDANRPSTFHGEAGQKVENELRALYETHGYPKVLRWLSRYIKLV